MVELKQNINTVLFNAIQEALILVNKSGKILYINTAGMEMFGYSLEELHDQSVEVLVPEAIRTKHANYRTEYMEQPVTKILKEKLSLKGVKKGGKEFPIQISLNPFKNEKGEQFIVALVSDITLQLENNTKLAKLRASLEQKVKDRTIELKTSEHLYKSIARNFPSGVISIFDSDYKYQFAEGQGLDELGIATEDLIGLDYLERIEEQARHRVKEELDKVFKGESRTFEVNIKGQVYIINAVPLHSEDGLVDRILVVERNITNQAEAAQKMEQALHKERELTEMKSRFVSMASHEFRTPLATINSSATLIKKYYQKQQCDKIEKHIDRIKNAVQNLTSILNDFLSFEKLEAGKVEVHFMENNIPQLIHETFDEMGDITKPHQVLKYKGPEELLIPTDNQLLKNTILNILSNAIKYSDDGTEIVVSLEVNVDNVKIAIQDFGMGIPKKDQKELFTRFFRSENVANIEGTGLGLNIVQRYLDLLKGEIAFQSELGKGTTFFITLPKKYLAQTITDE